MKGERTMRNHRPVVRALLMTTAVAWSIGVRLPETDADPQAPAEWSSSADDARRQPGPVVLPFRRNAPTLPGDAGREPERGAA